LFSLLPIAGRVDASGQGGRRGEGRGEREEAAGAVSLQQKRENGRERERGRRPTNNVAAVSLLLFIIANEIDLLLLLTLLPLLLLLLLSFLLFLLPFHRSVVATTVQVGFSFGFWLLHLTLWLSTQIAANLHALTPLLSRANTLLATLLPHQTGHT